MKMHKLTVYVVDSERMGPDEVKSVIENQKYPNWCINPRVEKVETVDIGEWSDDHPMNRRDCDRGAYFEKARGRPSFEEAVQEVLSERDDPELLGKLCADLAWGRGTVGRLAVLEEAVKRLEDKS